MMCPEGFGIPCGSWFDGAVCMYYSGRCRMVLHIIKSANKLENMRMTWYNNHNANRRLYGLKGVIWNRYMRYRILS